MATTLSGRFARPSYRAVPIEASQPEPRSLSQYGDSPSLQQLESGPWRFSFDRPDQHERAPFELQQAGLPLDHHEPESETGEPSNGSSARSNKGSSISNTRERWWRWRSAANRCWFWEVLGAVVSVACFVVLVTVLHRSDRKEQTRWLYNRLTLNGLIALLTTFIRASMMLGVGAGLSQMKWNHFSSYGSQRGRKLEDLDAFDQASRGPLGSIRLIFTRTRPHLGLIGSLITIFTLAFDAFAQEVIIFRFDNKSGANGTTVGQVARSEMYNHWTKVVQETNWVNDLNTVAAEYNGIFNYQNITAPVAQCSTGNCTWPIVPSLAVCGSCTDVTASMSYSCVGISGSSSTYISADEQNCTYTLPEGQSYYASEPGYTFWTSPTGQSMTGQEVLAYVVVGSYVSPHYNESNHVYLDTWLMINISLGAVTANVCGLWFCVQAYETSVDNGIPTQKITANWSETDYDSEAPRTYGPVNFTNVPSDIRLAANYSVDAGVLIAFSQNPIFSDGNITYGMDSLEFYEYSSTTVRSLHSIVDYSAWIDLFALGMSNNVRSTGTSSTPVSTYAGEVLTSVPFVHVRWPWLAFPAAMVAASLLFLVACIWQTSYLHVDPWKGDAMALLLASVDGETGRDSASMWKIEGDKVRLQSVEGSAVFRKIVAEKG